MSSEPITTGHPVLRFAHQLTARLEQVATSPVWSMSQAEQRDALRELARAEAQLAALKLRVLAEAERSGAGQERAAASAADWVAIETRQTRISARSDLKLATALDHHRMLAAALDTGDGQHRAGTGDRHRAGPAPHHRGVRRRPRPTRPRRARTWSGWPPTTTPKRWRCLGRRVFEVIAPDLAEAHDGKVLADLEAAAARRTTLVMSQDDAGTVHGRFRIPTLHGQWLKKMILTLCSPARSTTTDIDDTLPTDVRHGLALCQLIEAIPTKSLPKAGGTGATIVVTMTPRPAPRRPRPSRPPQCRGLRPRHRRPDHRRPSPTPGLHRRPHPRRPRRTLPGPRPRPPLTPLPRTPDGSPWASETKAAPPRTANNHPRCATPTTTPPGPAADQPIWPTADSSADTTTAASTTPTTPLTRHPNGKVSFHRRT